MPERHFIVRPRPYDFEWGGHNQASTYPGTWEGQRGHGDDSPQFPALRRPRKHVIYYRNLHPSSDWEEVFRETNGNINRGEGQQINPWNLENMAEREMPKFECVIYPGTTGYAIEWAGNRANDRAAAKIEVFRPEDPVPSPSQVNWMADVGDDSRFKITKFVGIHRDGHYVNLFDPAVDCYLPMMSSEGYFWIERDAVEWYPQLGNVTVLVGALNVRNAPGIVGEKIGLLNYMDVVEIKKYYPTMGNIWGLTDYGWIALRYQPYPGFQYYYEPTSFHLFSPPALRPYRTLSGSLPVFQDGSNNDYNLTNQAMINIFYQAAATVNENGWVWIEQAGLTSMAVPRENRSLPYSGPNIETIIGLDEIQKEKLLEIIQ